MRRFRIRNPFVRHTPPNLSNSQLSPSGSSARKRETPGILSQMFFPLRRYHLIPREGRPNTAVRLPHIPSIANTQLSPSGSSIQKRETPRILSRMFPPFAGITSYCVREHLTPLLVMPCSDMHMFALYSLFLPPLLSGRLRDRRRCWCPNRLRW